MEKNKIIKKLLLILLCLPFIGLGQNVNIPDANFKAYLVSNWAINTNGDTEIQVSEANVFNGSIHCQNLNISDLTGIEDFTFLNALYCSYNQLTSLDVSGATALTSLYCSSNNITSLDLSNNTNLTTLHCFINQITTLDVSNNTNLTDLRCSYNALTTLNVSNGNNVNMILLANGNNNLLCIEVDDVSWSTSNWTVAGTNIDAWMSFSTDCSTAFGCTDNCAINYNSLAIIDDSSCTYPGSLLFTIACDSLTWNNNTYFTSGTYTDTSTYSNGCINIDSLELIINNSTSNSTNATACDSYTWIDGNTYNSNGTYTYLGYNLAGCQHTETLNLTINNSTSSAMSDTACGSYTWSTDGNTYTSSGIYTSTGTNSLGCIHTDSLLLTITINNVNLFATSSNVSCNGFIDGSLVATVTGGLSPYQYSLGGGLSQTSGTFSNLTAGTYSLDVTDINGCSSNQSIIITEPNPLFVNAFSTDVSCFGYCDGSTFSMPSGGTSPYSYLWSNGNITDNISALCAGAYVVNITDANNCVNIETVVISEPFLLSTSINVTDETAALNDGSANAIVLGGVSPYSYSWSNGSATNPNLNLSPGLYTLDVIDANGCIVSTSVTVNAYTPTDIIDIENASKNLRNITDMLGQETPYRKNTPLFYIYDDGTVEKRIVIE